MDPLSRHSALHVRSAGHATSDATSAARQNTLRSRARVANSGVRKQGVCRCTGKISSLHLSASATYVVARGVGGGGIRKNISSSEDSLRRVDPLGTLHIRSPIGPTAHLPWIGTLGPQMVTNCRGGGKTSGSVEGGKGTTYYERSYPVCTEEPVRREGATCPERPKRMRLGWGSLRVGHAQPVLEVRSNGTDVAQRFLLLPSDHF